MDNQGAKLIVLAQSQPWVPSYIEKYLTDWPRGIDHLLVVPTTYIKPFPGHIELGVRKYHAAITEVHPEYGMTAPSKSGCICCYAPREKR